MKTGRYLIYMAVLAVSCSETMVDDTRVPIRFSAGFNAGLETRAFLNSDDISDSNTEFTIYGYNGSSWFIDGETAGYDVSGDLTLDVDKYWEAGKNYSFFAWLSKDKDGHEFTTTGTNPDIDISNIKGSSGTSGSPVTPGSTRSLKVNAKTFDFAAVDTTFDFCYSDVVYRPSSKPDHSDVKFKLNHLFTAVAFSAHNYTGSAITLKEVTVVGLKNKKSATITFADAGATVAYPSDDVACSWENSSKTLYSSTTGTNIVANSGYANVVGTPSNTKTEYYMFWPQTSDELAATGWTDNATAPTGGAYLKVVYSQGGPDKTRYAKFPEYNDGTNNLGWPAASKQKIELAFSDNQFTLKFKAAPWDYTTPVINYDEKINSSSCEQLHFDETNCNVDKTKHIVTFKEGYPITCIFKIPSPLNATWVISKEGDYDAFEIDNAALDANGDPISRYGDGKDYNYGTIDGNDCKFTLFPKVSNTGRSYSIQLTFSVRYVNGESVNVDDIIQPVTWTFILTD